MNRKAEYKSAIRSRKMIRHAFVELVLEKDIEKITIRNIVEKAEISRGTFYAHYSDIYAVFEEIENEIMGEIAVILNEFKSADIIQNPRPCLEKMALFFNQDIEFYRKSINTKYTPNYVKNIKELLVVKILSYEETHSSIQKSKEFTLRVHFYVGGLISLFQEWLEGTFECTLNELTATITKFMVQGLQSNTLK
ncbi:TetR/AcrR family transcriptional regulator [Bacillus sp. 1P06AnD]|uniref:TetR/AcrR family transcriptional regulator n=1 Tax=Bacillus sp. 1P06AnD TaxID=3132208 RepID=UPI0039A369B1